MRFATFTLTLALTFADTPPAAAYVGTWLGSAAQSFGLANPAVPGSWECLPNAYVVSRASSIVIEANSSVKLAEMQSVAVEVAGGSYLIPATPEIEYKWAAYNPESGILQLRPIANLAAIECFYFVQHNSSAVTLEVLGGGVITAGNWWLQCTNSSYAAMANVSTPACIPLAPPRDLSPRNTTVVFSGAPPVSPIPIASSARSESLLAATLAFAVLVSAMAC